MSTWTLVADSKLVTYLKEIGVGFIARLEAGAPVPINTGIDYSDIEMQAALAFARGEFCEHGGWFPRLLRPLDPCPDCQLHLERAVPGEEPEGVLLLTNREVPCRSCGAPTTTAVPGPAPTCLKCQDAP